MSEIFLSQLFGQGDWISNIVWFLLFFAFILFAPRLMVTQTVLKLEKQVMDLEGMARNARNYITRNIPKGSKVKTNIRNFMEFFAVPPVDVDPYGIIKKLNHIIRQSDQRFKYFVRQIAPTLSEERQKDIKNALAGAITTHQIAKVVRHFLELIKKYKMFQLAMLLQMQIPLIIRVAKASMHATHAFVDESPIGDSIGPLVAVNLIKGRVRRYDKEDFIVYKTKINGRNVFVSKASGPGATIGKPGKFLQKFIKRNKINRIITVDAAMKLEGEKLGSVAKGVGVAMGGYVDKYEIEEIAVKKNIPLDAVAVKVSDEDALMPMKREIANAVPNAIRSLNEIIKTSGRREKILIMGIGNTCGIGDNFRSLEETKRRIIKGITKLKREQAKKKGGIFKWV